MNADTAQRILALNHQFYQSFGGDFSETRGRLQPGVQRLIPAIPAPSQVLDLGCGNGELVRQLAAAGFQGTYLGADFSSSLLAEAARRAPANIQARFLELDLAAASWQDLLSGQIFDRVLCFAVLHHIPSQQLQQSVCSNIRRVISPDGQLLLSNWQFLKSKRLAARILPWSEAGLAPDEIDPGDYLLDWRRGGRGLRYVHHFSPAELQQLAIKSGFKIVDAFDSDGREGDLSLYQVWEPD